MPPPTIQYNTQTQPKENVIIQKTKSHQHNIHLQNFNAVINPSTGEAMKYNDLIKDTTAKVVRTRSMANNFRRLAKGVGTRMKKGTEKLNS